MSVSFAAALKTSFSSANTCIDLFQKNERRVADLEQDFKQFISKDKKELADGRGVDNVVGELKADLRDDHIRKRIELCFWDSYATYKLGGPRHGSTAVIRTAWFGYLGIENL
ncbi:unnamed protein product [Meganyctiphanes norvegica]|uniref:Uncharacterized protein n=1 Tax=Meganyctiphanes norvegica TaxID=48144 RepID=A0AAV2REE7_MEGNR